MKTRLIIVILAVVVISGLVALFIFGRQTPETELAGTLNFWGVFDSSGVIQQMTNGYKALHPKAKIEIVYRELNPALYENNLINELAGTNGPDIFMFHNSWLPKHYNKISPIGSDSVSFNNFRNLFPTVVQQDFAPDGVIYALPLYVDTLAMFYNQDIFDGKGIALPPKTWEDLEKLVPKLRQIDKQGRVQKAAAAIGGSNKSINRATDILNLVMLQTGTQMVSQDFSAATFNSVPGLNALNFYTKFANPAEPLYTWSDGFANSVDSFAAGETAIMFSYSHQADFLKEKNPFLNFRIAPMLQPQSRTQDVNWANYWGAAISNKTANRALAQDFLLYLTTNPEVSKKYLQLTNRPPALRGLITEYIATQPQLGIFANQTLTARSWPQIDNVAVETIFSDMIISVLTGKFSEDRALSEAAGKVTTLMEQRIK